MGKFSAWSILLLLSMLTAKVRSEEEFDLADALGGDDSKKAPTPAPKLPAPAGGAGAELDLNDFFNNDGTTTKAPSKVAPKTTRATVKPKPKPDESQSWPFPTRHPDLLTHSTKSPVVTRLPPKGLPAGEDFNLGDALDPNNDIGGKDKNKGRGGFSDDDLADLAKDDNYKPDKGKDGRPSGGSGQIDQSDDNNDTMAETGTIAGIVSAVAMALVGAVSSYISYQKKKLCFSIQQSMNTDVKAENLDAVVATEPQETLREPPNAEPPNEENPV
ncbi:CD99 antigen-like protein 2 [Polymixia lowei]